MTSNDQPNDSSNGSHRSPIGDQDEPLISRNKRRFVLFPIRYRAIWKAYKHAMTTMWISDDLGNSDDSSRWETAIMTPTQKQSIQALTVLLGMTQKAHESLKTTVYNEITAPEARCFFAYQMVMENVHREAISRISSIVLDDEQSTVDMIKKIDEMSSMTIRQEWIDSKSNHNDQRFSDNITLLTFIQGLFVSTLNILCDQMFEETLVPSLNYAFKKILVDRESYLDFTTLLFYHVERRPSTQHVKALIMEMVSLEKDFATELTTWLHTSVSLDTLHKNIEHEADFLLISMGYESIYNLEYDTIQQPSIRIASASEKAAYFVEEMTFAYVHPSPHDDALDIEINFDGLDF